MLVKGAMVDRWLLWAAANAARTSPTPCKPRLLCQNPRSVLSSWLLHVRHPSPEPRAREIKESYESAIDAVSFHRDFYGHQNGPTCGTKRSRLKPRPGLRRSLLFCRRPFQSHNPAQQLDPTASSKHQRRCSSWRL
ncbi:hypothetical protein B0T19DRAFT_270363 [Cercophora scortea]|uniref:Uncharacterized protein n=1 Tax=Cercophora scortea TaxID=314031 RepID=A0AAE0I710_9PEZI|nr:hypothetical protein B0T19DRAFT_270363 [Cercophora scortea]